MAYEPKANSGTLFINQKRTSQSQPSMRGDVHLDKTFLIGLMDKSYGPLVKVSLAAWNKTSAAGNEYLSLQAAEPWEPSKDTPTPAPAAKPTLIDNSDIPF